MKKTILSLIAVCVLSLSAQAQIDFGLRLGANFTDLKLKDVADSQTYSDIANGGMDYGYHFGAYLNLNLFLLELQPEILYTRVNGSLEGIDASGKTFSEDLGIHTVDIPFNVIFGMGPIRLGAGPVISYQFASASEIVGFNGFNNIVWNAQFLAGVELGKIQLDVRYQLGLTSALESLTIGSANAVSASANTSQIIFALGIDLGFLVF